MRAGVAPATLAAIVAGDAARLSPEVALGVRFARAVLAHDPDVDACREEIVQRWGARAVLALAFSVMNAQLYPTLKYALGYGKACTRIVVAGETVAPAHLGARAA